MKISIGGKISVGYCLVLVSLLLVGAVSFRNLRQLNEDSTWVDHTLQVLRRIESLSGKTTEAESCQRGYLITRQQSFLDRFEVLKPLIHDDIRDLRRLTQDNPAQQTRLNAVEPVLGERISLLDRVLRLNDGRPKASGEETALLLKGQQDMAELREGLQQMESEEQRLLDERRLRAKTAEENTAITITWGTLLAFLVVAGASWIIVRGITSSLRSLNETADQIGAGDYTQRAEVRGKDEIGQLAVAFNRMAGQVEERQELLARQEWLKGNLARFTVLFQGQRDLQSICRILVAEIASVLGARRVAFYLVESTPAQGRSLLRWKAGYAVADDKRVIHPGEGLLGQCYVDKKPLYIDDVPESYFKVASALGEAPPRVVAILPILFEDHVKGVLEIAAFRDLSEIQKSFLSQLLSGVGLVLNSLEAGMRTEELLRQAEVLSADLEARQSELHEQNLRLEEQTLLLKESEVQLQGQQEELRQTNEELQQTNEELGQANSELEERAHRLEEQRIEMERKNTEIEAAQQALEEKADQLAQTSKYKSEFLANMSHELRTPLNSLLILSNMLAENGEKNLSPKQIQYADTIRGAGNDLLQLINDILDLAKIESGTVEVEPGDLVFADLSHLMERAFAPVAESRSLEFSVEIDPALPRSMETDVRRVQQVMKNLLSNAFKFTENGSVRMKVAAEPNGEVSFRVRDTGIGISEEKQQIIFEAFQQGEAGTSRRYGGTGLGLSISREIARLLGGSLRVASTMGEGSEFILTLPGVFRPASDAKVAEAPQPSTPSRPAKTAPGKRSASTASKGTPSVEPIFESERCGIADDRAAITPDDLVLLVVEDDANFSRLMVDFAHEQGFKVVVTREAGNVLSLAERFKPAAITLDLGLPDREGWMVLDQLKHTPSTRHIPVHIMSVREERSRGLKLGAVSYLKKPVTRGQIEAMLGQIREFASQAVKNLLIVEDDARQRQSLVDLIGNGDVVTTAVGTGAAALEALAKKRFDCLILDLGLPDVNGFELIRKIKEREGGEDLPIIIYTGRELTRDEERDLHRLTEAIIIKNVRSPERLLDETALFLHRVQSRLPEAKRKAIEVARQEDSSLAGQTVLVVDDDPRNIFAITAALEQYRMEVLFATTGAEGLEMLEEHPEIRAVLMDIMMPEMDGFEAMHRIRANPKHHSLPILAITAKAMKGDREKCLDAGASDYVTKPVDMEQLRSLLRVWLYR